MPLSAQLHIRCEPVAAPLSTAKVHRSLTGRCCTWALQTLCFPAWNDVMAESWLCQWMCIYMKNNPAKFHPHLIWNNGVLGFWRGQSTQKQEQQQEDK